MALPALSRQTFERKDETMKRYVCTVAAGVLLALAGAGTAAATGSPPPDQTQAGTQSVSFGDQSVGEQKNDADVDQYQGNGNVNIAPAVAIFGDASTKNAQGNDNEANADIDQSNTANQSQKAEQDQSLEQDDGSCCSGRSQTGEQSTEFGDQTVEKQKNDADVEQYQGNGNRNFAPAVAIFGDASTWNAQGNGNKASADIDQSNKATQSQSAEQQQDLSQQGRDCCDRPHKKKDGYGKKRECCDDGPSQTGEQTAYFGDQRVEKQKNDADVDQYQGNHNKNWSPALSFGGFKRDSCSEESRGKCDGSYGHGGGDASTWNAQGNGNQASADIDQSNKATQSQTARQSQDLRQACEEVVRW
jgi:hypothetical protein